MGQAKKGDKVQVIYKGKLKNGKEEAVSPPQASLEFTLGKKEVIQGFEEAVVGMAPGEEKTVTVPEDKAYGPRRKELVREVPRDQLPGDLEPEVGQKLQILHSDGHRYSAVVKAVSESGVIIDSNHPFAGADMIFDIQLQEIVD